MTKKKIQEYTQRIEKLGNIGSNGAIPCRKWHVYFANTEGDLVAGCCQASYRISVMGWKSVSPGWQTPAVTAD